MIRMWGRSLITIQRVDRATWLKLDIVSKVRAEGLPSLQLLDDGLGTAPDRGRRDGGISA